VKLDELQDVAEPACDSEDWTGGTLEIPDHRPDSGLQGDPRSKLWIWIAGAGSLLAASTFAVISSWGGEEAPPLPSLVAALHANPAPVPTAQLRVGDARSGEPSSAATLAAVAQPELSASPRRVVVALPPVPKSRRSPVKAPTGDPVPKAAVPKAAVPKANTANSATTLSSADADPAPRSASASAPVVSVPAEPVPAAPSQVWDAPLPQADDAPADTDALPDVSFDAAGLELRPDTTPDTERPRFKLEMDPLAPELEPS